MGAECSETAGQFVRFGRSVGLVSLVGFVLKRATTLNRAANLADSPDMGVVVIVLTLGAAALAGLLMLNAMASRIDHAERLSRLVRETRRLRSNRAAEQAATAPARRRH
jgi:hypothetical protein